MQIKFIIRFVYMRACECVVDLERIAAEVLCARFQYSVFSISAWDAFSIFYMRLASKDYETVPATFDSGARGRDHLC